MKEMLEHDALRVLQFMASNGLVANPKKTAFMILNHKQDLSTTPISITIGNEKIMAEKSAKLLGVTLDNDQKWKSQILGKGGVISNLNSRLYLLRRLACSISRDRLKRIADSLYTSKVRYGLQLLGKVRLSNSDPSDTLLDALQIAQNKFARFLHGSTLLDRISTKTIFKETNLSSINQLNAQIKLLEVWKSQNITSYPTKWKTRIEELKREGLKSINKPELIITGRTNIQSMTFINDAAKVWNNAPSVIKECTSMSSVKKLIKTFTKTLPI